MDIVFFDAYACIGPRLRKHGAERWTLDHVLEDMRHCSIAGALVCHQLGIVYDPMHGNRLLCRELEPHPDLYPMWNVVPHHTAQFPPPDELLELMRQHDVRAVTLNPVTNFWDLLSEANHALLSVLESSRTLTVIRRTELQDFDQLETLLLRFPDMPVLLSHVGWSEQRYVMALMELCPNLHLTFNHYQVHYGPEWLVELGYEDRLVYSSNAPEMSMGAHRTYIDYADIPEETRAKIAGGNLKRLLKGQGPSAPASNPDEDDMMRRARLGQPQEATVIDPHMHMLHSGMHGDGRVTMHDGGPEGVLRLVRRLGYDGGGILSWNVIVGDSLGGNEAVRLALDVFPDGYWGAGSFDPTHCTQDELRELIPALYADPRFKELKPFFFALRYDDPLYDVWWEVADKHRLMVLLDRNRSGNDFSEVDDLAERFPNASWIVPHCGASFPLADAAIACAGRHANVYLDITYTSVPAGMVEYLVEGAGADRVLYGSDLPMRDPRPQLGWVIYARLPLEAREKVLGLNAARLRDRCVVGGK